jgi:hypothetical protein
MDMHCFGGEGWGDGRRAGRVGAACESDPTSTPVEMYWLSPPVRLRLIVRFHSFSFILFLFAAFQKSFAKIREMYQPRKKGIKIHKRIVHAPPVFKRDL